MKRRRRDLMLMLAGGLVLLGVAGGYLLHLRRTADVISRRLPEPSPGGKLFIGGGGLSEELYEHFLHLAGGKAARVVVIDQHFLRRNRFRRLFGILAEHPHLIGLGIDEGTAVLVEGAGKTWRVVGESYAVICLPKEGRFPHIEVLSPGGWTNIESLKEAIATNAFDGKP